MTSATKTEETQFLVGHNVFVDRAYVHPFLELIGKPHAMDALAIEKHDAEVALVEAENRYMESQYRLAQLNQSAPAASGDERSEIDAERHDLRHSLEDQPVDLEHAARVLFEVENRIYSELTSTAVDQGGLARQKSIESQMFEDSDRHNQINKFNSNFHHVLRHHENLAGAAEKHRLEITRKYSNLPGIEAEYRRRKQADRDKERFPDLNSRADEIRESYDDRQGKRLAKLVEMFDEAFADAENTRALYSGVAADLSAIERRGNAPHGYKVTGNHAVNDLANLREIERAMKRIQR